MANEQHGRGHVDPCYWRCTTLARRLATELSAAKPREVRSPYTSNLVTVPIRRALMTTAVSIALVASAGGAQVDASASQAGWSASRFETVKTAVAQGDHITVDCTGSMPNAVVKPIPGGAFAFLDLGFDGDNESDWLTQLVEISQDTAVASSGGPLDFNVDLRDLIPSSSNDESQTFLDFEAPEAGFAKAAWAAWGYEFGCTLSVNGTPALSTASDGSLARLYFGEDFDSSSSPSLAARPAVETFAGSKMTKTLPGSTFMILWDSGWVSDMEVTATSPTGEVLDPAHAAWSRGLEPGVWNFAVDGVVVMGGLPPVSLIQVPEGYL